MRVTVHVMDVAPPNGSGEHAVTLAVEISPPGTPMESVILLLRRTADSLEEED